MALVEIILCRALYAHGTLGGLVNDAARIGSSGLCAHTTCWITGSSILAINGTAPGVLLRVWRWWVQGVFLRCLFAVGFRDCMIGGASMILSIVIIGVFVFTPVPQVSPFVPHRLQQMALVFW